MRTLRAGLTALVAATLLLVALPRVAGAATTGTTTTTFTLTGGSISITVPGSTVNLGSLKVWLSPDCSRALMVAVKSAAPKILVKASEMPTPIAGVPAGVNGVPMVWGKF